MSEAKISLAHLRLVKPTLETPFHINRGWWEQQGRDFRIELRTHLCSEHREVYRDHFDTEVIDWIDDQTGEVTRVDGLQHVIREHCSLEPGYLGQDVSLVDVVFRVFLANGNKPLSAQELGDITGRRPDRILRTLSGQRVYKGLSPVVGGR
jgi:hypothetical protein